MTASPHCPKCRATLPADAPGGLCPYCLLGAALVDPDEEHVRSRATGAVGGVLDLALDRATGVPASDNDRVVSGALRVVEIPDLEAPWVDAGASWKGLAQRTIRSPAECPLSPGEHDDDLGIKDEHLLLFPEFPVFQM